MSFRKKQFQFSDLDPSERREELLKRFGFKPEEDKGMFFESSPMRSGWPEWESRLPRTGHFEEPHWRTRSSGFSSSDSAPGSPRMGMGMPNMKWNNEESIPIKVVHEQTHKTSQNCDDTTDSETSSQGSGQNIRTQKKPHEPRVHHIPIRVEPREGSTSSGYASDGGPDDQARSSSRDIPHHVSGTSAQNSTPETQAMPGVQQLRHCFEPNWSNSPQSNEQYQKSKVHHIPINLETGGEALHTGVHPFRGRSPSPTHSNVLRSSSGPPNTASDSFSPSRPSVIRSASGPYPPQESASFKPNAQYTSNTMPHQKGKSNGPYVSKISLNKNDKQTHNTPGASSSHQQKTVVDPMQQVANIQKEVQELRTKVDKFVGTSKDKLYRYLDEMLTRCLLKLDNIDTGGQDEVRLARKAAIKEVQGCLSILENKAAVTPPEKSHKESNIEYTTEASTADNLLEEQNMQNSVQGQQQVTCDKMEVGDSSNQEVNIKGTSLEDSSDHHQTCKKVLEEQKPEEPVSKKMAVEEKQKESKGMEVDVPVQASQFSSAAPSHDQDIVMQDDKSPSKNSSNSGEDLSNKATCEKNTRVKQSSEETCDQMTKL